MSNEPVPVNYQCMKAKFQQDRLYKRKRDFLILKEYEGFGVRRLAKMFGCSKSTISNFQRSDRYQFFRAMVLGDPVSVYLLKKYDNLENSDSLNEMTEKQVLNKLKNGYNYVKKGEN